MHKSTLYTINSEYYVLSDKLVLSSKNYVYGTLTISFLITINHDTGHEFCSTFISRID
jgi:hypothetical protein